MYENRSAAADAAAAADADAAAADAAAADAAGQPNVPRVIERIARSWLPLFKLMKSGRAQVQLAAAYVSYIRAHDDECFKRFLQECRSPLGMAALVKTIVSGGLKSDSLAEEVGIDLLLRSSSGLSAAHVQQLLPRGGAAKIIKKLAGNLKSGRVLGSDRSWSLSLDLLHFCADLPFALESLNKIIYAAAAKGSASSRRSAARVVLELLCSARWRRAAPPPLPLPTLLLYAQVIRALSSALRRRC